MSKALKCISAALLALTLAGCISWRSGKDGTQNLGAGDPPAQQQTYQQSNGFADKQYIWQDWTPSSTQAAEKVK